MPFKKLLVLVMLTACAPPSVDVKETPNSVWVCHNPKSEYHGEICSEECYWAGGLRAENSFCWLLEKKDCDGPIELEWQRKNCHLVE